MFWLGMREEDVVSPPAEGDLRSALTFSLVPLAPVESARSLPARSTKLILLTCRQRGGSALWAQQTLPSTKQKTSCSMTLL